MDLSPLTRDEVAAVIAGRGAARRVPLFIHLWVHPEEFGEREPAVQALLAKYPCDIQAVYLRMPEVYQAPVEDPEYRWMNRDAPPQEGSAGLDALVALSDWGMLDDVLAAFPRADSPCLLPQQPPRDERYRLGHWWFSFFERHWSLRGMENALTDYYLYPDKVHRLYSALADFYCGVIERAADELGADGILTSDDLGAQSAPMFSPEVFCEFLKPYYARLIETAHARGMQFWLHCCGSIEPFLEDFIEIGLDVLHPIQKYTMDERQVARQCGGRLAFYAGFDVQQIIPWGTPGEVRQEVHELIDTFQRPEGRLVVGAGNGINGDCPVDSLEALLDEAIQYGTLVCA